jgi:hypothetical protein
MFDIAKAVEKTKRAREKNLKETIKTICRQIKGQINAGNTYTHFSLWYDDERVTRIVKHFENKGYMVSCHNFGNDIDIRISWDYVEEDN